MSNIIINNRNHTIEMNKTISKAASVYGTPEYNELQNVRRDYPTYRVVTVGRKATKNEYKGLTYEYMEKYIAKHDDDKQSKMTEYKMLRGMDEDGLNVDADSADYADIKEWFFQTFPEINEYHKKREELLKKIAEAKAAKEAA